MMFINGVEIPNPDVSDVAFLEKYEAAHDKVAEKANEIVNNASGMRRSQAVRKQCESIFNFFEEVFGEGTAKKVFGDSVNLKTCINAYEDCVVAINKLDTEVAQEFKKKASRLKSDHHHNKHTKKKKKHYNNYKPKLVAPTKS